MSRWAPAERFFGLHVDFGHWHHHRRVWLRLPTARLTCRAGCEFVAVGEAEVTFLTHVTAPEHARACLGQTPDTRTHGHQKSSNSRRRRARR